MAEVKDGRIELVRIARTPGVRTKVAVASGDTTRGASSPIGIIVGERGSRIRLIRDALGEELDLLEYDPDPLNLVIAALAPAKVRRVEKSAAGYVAILAADERDSVAGEDGQGLKLASELVGAPIELLVEDSANVQARAGRGRRRVLVHPPQRPALRQRRRARHHALRPAGAQRVGSPRSRASAISSGARRCQQLRAGRIAEPLLVLLRRPAALADQQLPHVGVVERPEDVGRARRRRGPGAARPSSCSDSTTARWMA